jgi:hypothetical protein|tara:strand:+ start:59 stop:364 length:306 start_codon:yes stop_codon:yes gene_type:complete
MIYKKNFGAHWKEIEFTAMENWIECKVCLERPRLWIFDNGRYAKCSCYGEYESGLSSISVMEWYKINTSFVDYPSDELRLNWNNRCFSVNRDIKISEILNE